MRVFKITTIFLCCFLLSCTFVFANEDAGSEVASDNSDEVTMDEELKEEIEDTLDVLEDLYRDQSVTIVLTLPNNEDAADGAEKDSKEQLQVTCNEELSDDNESMGGADDEGVDDLDINTSPPDENGMQISIIKNGKKDQQLQNDQQNDHSDKYRINNFNPTRRWVISVSCSQQHDPGRRSISCLFYPCRRIIGTVYVTSLRNISRDRVARAYCYYARRAAENRSYCCRLYSCSACWATPL